MRDHLPPEAVKFLTHDRDWCLLQAARVGRACHELVIQLLDDRILERLRAAQGVLRLKDTYGAQRLEAACERALHHASPYYRTVKTILVGGHDRQPLANPASASPYAAGARFVRAAHTLFDPDASRH